MKVALVHDWLTGLRGGERCLEAFLKIYPKADIFCMLHVKGSTSLEIDSRVVKQSWLGELPAAANYYRALLPLYPLAIKSLDLTGYDLVISLSHAAAKNVSVPKEAKHISYCFTPMRYIWDQAPYYFGKLTPLLWPFMSYLRGWDKRRSVQVDSFVAISRFVASRIRCYYGRSAHVIYPPVNTDWITPIERYQPGVAFLYAGALVPYKRVDLVVEAFNRLGQELWIVGNGPEEARLKKIAKNNISFFGKVSDRELADFYSRSRALIFPGTEDFGMVPVECLAAGRPVIGSYSGALRETLTGLKPWDKSHLEDQPASGVFFNETLHGEGSKVDALISSIRFFMEREDQFKPSICRARAEIFSDHNFFKSWSKLACQLKLPLEDFSTESAPSYGERYA